MPIAWKTLQTKPEQSKALGPVEPQWYGEPKRSSIAAINNGWNLGIAGAVELVVVETVIRGLGLASQVGLVSDAEVEAINAGSSIEHETSLDSGCTILCRV